MNDKQQYQLIKKYSAQTIIETLEPFVSDLRKQRIEQVVASRLNSIQLAIEAPSDLNNALATIRTAEALGITNVYITNPEYEATHTRKITQGAFYWAEVSYYSAWAEFLNHIKTQKIILVGATVSSSNELSQIPIDQPICLLMGNEHRGLTQIAQNSCDFLYHIPMYGMTESLNLSVAAAMSLYDTTSRKRKALLHSGDLNEAEKLWLRARYFLNSVSDRLAINLLKSLSHG